MLIFGRRDEHMTYAALVVRTLEAAADRHGDPTEAIYAELFAAYPELEALFWLDRDNGVRASMVQQAWDAFSITRASG
ncbi:MAG: hypothetical protein B7Y90_17550 [Alphaproteobacteria bacterium 32-64-14]|nr:MAG: hypothetical protein B7Y90_17550 [Alphaproteobacteria bacterium 32-64-14]